MLTRCLRWFFFALLVRPLTWIILGLNIRHYERLPMHGPAIIVANHNSHLDTLVLMSLFPLRLLPLLHPVAAADYFLTNRLVTWLSLHIIGIIPITRKRQSGVDPLQPVYTALEQGQIVIIFPEGTRGEPEQMGAFKRGIAYLAQKYPHIPVTPIFLHGLGKVLPRGEITFVPFFCDIFVGEVLGWSGEKQTYMEKLDAAMHTLAEEGQFAAWK